MEKLVVYTTLFLLGGILTLFTFDTWETVLLVSLLLVLISYVMILTADRITPIPVDVPDVPDEIEGFTTTSDTGTTVAKGTTVTKEEKETDANSTRQTWLETDELFDSFYASVFTKLTLNENLIQAESAICLQEFAKNVPAASLSVLDAGCGIGIATCALAKLGVGRVVGVDKSRAMIQYAKNHTLPHTTLTGQQQESVEFKVGDLIGPSTLMAGEVDAACILYFTIYYFGKQMDTLFRNLALWVKPGGALAIEVVNKYKFEPILDSSNPWVGISPQRYKKDRITTSHVVFDKFDYDAHFELQDPNAEFREVFRFKDGSVRRQRHRLFMPSISEIIQMASENGWVYTKYVDLMPLSFSYGYLLFFTRTP